MAQGLVEYVQQCRAQGYDEAGIREALRANGHSDTEISQAMGRSRGNAGARVLASVIFVALALSLIAYLLLQRSPPPVIPPPNVTVVNAEPSNSALSIASQLRASNKTNDDLYYESVQAGSKSASTTADGILICSTNREQNYKNYCLIELAGKQRDAGYCVAIGDPAQRDDCYLALILHGEDQYCAKLVLEQSKRTCDYLLGRA